MTPTVNRSGLRSLPVAALVGGSIAGGLDIFLGAVINGISVAKVLQAIASGLLGAASYQGGSRTIALGLLLQLLMSVVIAAIYAFSALKFPVLMRKPTRFGALYGVAIFIVMSFVVVPLSAVEPKPHPSATAAVLQFGAMIGFGLIVAWTLHLLRERRWPALGERLDQSPQSR